MKVVAVLCTLFVLSQVEGRAVEPTAPKQAFVPSPLQVECIKELNLEGKKEDIGNLHNRAVCPEDNPDYNNFISCFWKKTNRQNKNGDINYDTLKQYVRAGIIQALGEDPAATNFAEENSSKIVAECKTVSGETPEKTVVKVRNCIVKGLDDIGKQ